MTQPAFEVCMKRLCALPCEGLRANLLIPWGSVTESHVEVSVWSWGVPPVIIHL